MSESNKHPSPSQPTKPTQEKSVKKPEIKVKKSPWLLWLLSGISIGLISFAGYLYWVESITIGSLTLSRSSVSVDAVSAKLVQQNEQLSIYQNELIMLSEKIADFENNKPNADVDQSWKNEVSAMQSQVLDLSKEIETVKLTNVNPDIKVSQLQENYALAEADYLLKLAYQRILLQQDSVTATRLLTSVDQLLQQIEEVGIMPIKEQVKSHLVALQMVQTISVEDAYLELSTLYEMMQVLPMLPSQHFETDLEQDSKLDLANASENLSEEVVASKADSWQGKAAGIWQKLDQYIRLQPRQDALDLIVLPEQQALLQMKLDLLLQQIKIALMKQHSKAYQAGLSELESNVTQFFVGSEQRDHLITKIHKLKELDIQLDLPDLLPTLQEMTNFLQQKHQKNDDIQIIKPTEKNSIVPNRKESLIQ